MERASNMRCPQCGALNPASADWCGQCLKRFTPPPPPAPPVAAPQTAAPPALHLVGAEPATVTSSPNVGAPVGAKTPTRSVPDHAVGTRKGAFAVTEAGVTWTCAACESTNPMEVSICSVCSTPLAQTLRPPEPERIARDPNTTAMISLFMPGAGHAYLELWPQAIARMFIQVWVVATALIGLIQGSVMLGVLFGIAATGLWAVAAHDAYREAQGQSSAVLLKGKAFLWLVLGLLTVLMVVVMSAGLRASSAL